MALEIIQGEKQDFNIDLNSKKSGKPFDLTGVVEITVCFKAGTTIISKLFTLSEVTINGAPTNGAISGFLSVADTDAMLPLDDGSIEVVIDLGSGDIKKSQIENAFSVLAKICP